ncbi:MAG: hypothetical protein COU32_01430 [Candidatus Magasanikbacteria bacterium CG10_big_fil_rev_8_21_14_0_10_42_10]|uniref:VTT domain-containing protein n=2 Tax=Candidatus Magasanikiibacteriota TaxID=1752731 RepID=A0A2H0TWN2_9BACT|nr:MAG: hypothetical protein COU32_01430 [Candidatus Magasanikbacteria bacterium CG10_big_fil_rev_8_21_14_0_10_42_10]PIZ92682.1 MAG: hypothetical protein COX82_04300 [Candidatus Magasanikbacteria bacterium CG_4_10_14_0_2_um_filter_41_10]
MNPVLSAPVLQLIIHYSYLIIIPMMIIEGPIITVIAGFLASLGYFNIFVVYLVMIAADLIGDTMYYAIGRWGGIPLIKKWGHYIGITEKHVTDIEKKIGNHEARFLFLGKIAHGFGTVFLLAAGTAKMPYGKFLLFNILPTLLKSLLFLLVGYYFGYAYTTIQVYVDYSALAMIVLAIIFVVLYVIIKSITRSYDSEKKI